MASVANKTVITAQILFYDDLPNMPHTDRLTGETNCLTPLAPTQHGVIIMYDHLRVCIITLRCVGASGVKRLVASICQSVSLSVCLLMY